MPFHGTYIHGMLIFVWETIYEHSQPMSWQVLKQKEGLQMKSMRKILSTGTCTRVVNIAVNCTYVLELRTLLISANSVRLDEYMMTICMHICIYVCVRLTINTCFHHFRDCVSDHVYSSMALSRWLRETVMRDNLIMGTLLCTMKQCDFLHFVQIYFV